MEFNLHASQAPSGKWILEWFGKGASFGLQVDSKGAVMLLGYTPNNPEVISFHPDLDSGLEALVGHIAALEADSVSGGGE